MSEPLPATSGKQATEIQGKNTSISIADSSGSSVNQSDNQSDKSKAQNGNEIDDIATSLQKLCISSPRRVTRYSLPSFNIMVQNPSEDYLS